MGTPDFAVDCLERLSIDNYDVVGVITQPDKPKGRNYTITSPPVKVCALTLKIPVFQPQTLKNEEILPLLNDLKPDLIVVTAYGKILPEYILNYPKLGCINIHASLLPKYRGASPIQWSIVNGETKTGITSMYVAKGLDLGDVILKSEIEILETDTVGDLHNKLAVLGAENLSKTIELIINNKAKREIQDDSQATYSPLLTKENTKIDWFKDSKTVYNLIRGLNPFPTAYTTLEGKIIKILSSNYILSKKENTDFGLIYKENNDILVKCKSGHIKLLEIIPEGGKKMLATDYFRGHIKLIGSRFEWFF